MRPHRGLLSALALLTTGCDKDPEPSTPEVECTLQAAPAATPVGGDANGDGHVDVSDGAFLARAQVAGGPAPSCEAAMDLVPNGLVDLADVAAIWYSLGPKSAPYRPSELECGPASRGAEPPCGDGLALAIEAPATAGESAEVSVRVESPSLPVEAWSFTLRAEGCTLDSGTTAGTVAVDKADGSGGLRQSGFAWHAVEEGEAKVLTVLDWRRQGTLPEGGAVVHRFSVSGACGTCTLTLDPGDPEAGVESVVSAGGYRYTPALGTAKIELCGG